MNHSKIDSISEPWTLLPLLYPLTENGSKTKYNYEVCKKGINNLINHLPEKENDYYEAINKAVSALYEKIKGQESYYFIDKTPRYYFILPEIIKTFPNAKFIFLLRNPLGIYASICETWLKGNVFLDEYSKNDLKIGPQKIIENYKKIKEKSILIKYEELVDNPESIFKRICKYLAIEYESEMLNNVFFSKKENELGDSNFKKFKKIDSSPKDEWKKFFNSRFKKNIAKKYLNYLDNEKIESFFYEKTEIKEELRKIKTNMISNLLDPIKYFLEYLKYLIKRNY
jgi:hypothetical protein